MLKKLLFFISLFVFLIPINLSFSEIVPLKKPSQTKVEKEQKLLIDVLKPLPKPIAKKVIKKEKKKTEEIVPKKEKKITFILPKKKPLVAGTKQKKTLTSKKSKYYSKKDFALAKKAITEMEKGKWIHAVQSASVGYHVEEFVSIVDLDGFSISLMSSQVWSFLKAISAELQGNYPEVNGGMYIINAPWAFQMIWKSIKLFLDPGTVAKIKILGSDYKGELSKIMDNDQIPIEYGGTFNSLKEICYTTDRREFAPKKRPDPGVAMMGDFHYIAEIERKGTLKGESIEEYNGSVESEVGSAPEVSEDKQAFSGDESEFSQYEDSDGETSQQHDNAPNENSVNESYENGESTPSRMARIGFTRRATSISETKQSAGHRY